MKLHLNFSHPFHFGHAIATNVLYPNQEIKIAVPISKNSLKKVKTNLKKLSPLHWYDGVWENLDYKM